MNKRFLLAANWKMHGTQSQAQDLVQHILAALLSPQFKKVKKDQIEIQAGLQLPHIVLFPPFVYLQCVAELIQNTPIKLGAQNLSQYDNGAYTGEISASMLKDIGCDYVLVGHSERRTLFGETNEIVALKFHQAIKFQLIPILCVGETQQERDKGQTQSIISQQIQAILKKSGIRSLKKAVIAYEPIWAIGTGEAATPKQAQAVLQWIRAFIAQQDAQIAQNLTILYGGSIKPYNAKALFQMPDIDGGLVGGASLDAEKFIKIYQAQ